MTRRDLTQILPIFALVSNAFGETQTTDAQKDKGERPITPHSGVYAFDKLLVKTSSSGARTRAVINGKLPTGEIVEIHETTLSPGQLPHPPHKHVHTEFMLIREGALEFILESSSEHLGPGGVAYAASGELHGIKNVGATPANYFVVAIGSQINES